MTPHRSLTSLARLHGPIMLLQLGRERTFVISSPNFAREIMKTHDIIFANRPYSSIARKLLYDYRDLSWSPYGEYWRQMRSICVMRLLNTRRVQSFRSLREEETIQMIEKVALRSCSGSSPIDLSEILISLTKNVICRAAFGMTCGEGEAGGKLKKLLEELGELLGMFCVGDFIPWLAFLDKLTGLDARVERVFKHLDSFLNYVIDHHMTRQRQDVATNGGVIVKEDQKDFLDVLLEIQNDGTNGISMARENMKAIILDMFAGGTDTTYTALEWALTELIKHSKTMKKVQEEVRRIAGSKSFINEDHIEKMFYLKAVIKETLRLHPPVPLLLPRQATKDVQVGGYNIPAKSRVIINAWAIGRDPASWEEPEKFKPERFLDNCSSFKGNDFQFIPFGAGRRGCPGATFATAIVDWALPGEQREEDLDVDESNGITIHRKFPLVVVATPHRF
ncbi:hypothetical protein AB3S75_024701 [Citrus x aurantiifolia]